MERMTHLNGNGAIYFIVDGTRVRIDDIPILRVAERLKLYEDAILAERIPEAKELFARPELRNAREVISRAEHGLLLIKELDRLEADLKKANDKCESYVLAMAAANARHAEENLEMLKIIKELTEKLNATEEELLRCKNAEAEVPTINPSGNYADKDGEKALEWAMGYCGRTNNAVTRYIADAVAEKLVRGAEQKGGEQ